jgi:hypothetical protein
MTTEPSNILNTSNMLNNNNVSDDNDIDETFDDKPVEIKLPELLSNDELDKIHGFLKGKSNKELSELVTKLLTKDKNKDELQRMQLTNSIMKNLGTSSKRELLNTLDTIINTENKHIVFDSADKLTTISEEKKSSNDELRKKLHQKIFMTNKKNQSKMYEKMMQQFKDSTSEKPDGTASEKPDESASEKPDDEKKKKKKNKKINKTAFQEDIVNQMMQILNSNQKS